MLRSAEIFYFCNNVRLNARIHIQAYLQHSLNSDLTIFWSSLLTERKIEKTNRVYHFIWFLFTVDTSNRIVAVAVSFRCALESYSQFLSEEKHNLRFVSNYNLKNRKISDKLSEIKVLSDQVFFPHFYLKINKKLCVLFCGLCTAQPRI